MTASRQGREYAGDPADDRRDEREQHDRPEDELAGRVRDPPQKLTPPWAPEGPNLEGEAPLLDLGQRRQDHRPDERQDTPQPGPDAALGVEAARSLSAGDDARALDH